MGAYAFSRTQSDITEEVKRGKIDVRKPFLTKWGKFDENPIVVRDYLRDHSTEYLRELIFIRIISALEAFFTDSLRDVYVHTTAPFKNQDSAIQYTAGEILSCRSLDDLQNKILARDRRKLTSGGIFEAEKYYKKIFDIDFVAHATYGSIKEYYDRRNLFVHSLGMSESGVRLIAKTDRQYKVKYKTSSRELEVPGPYLSSCISDVGSFAADIHTGLIEIITRHEEQEDDDLDEPRNRLSLKIELKAINLKEFEPRFRFKLGDNVYSLSTFIESHKKTDQILEMVLIGWEGALSKYYNLVKKLKSEGKIGKIYGNFDGREFYKE